MNTDVLDAPTFVHKVCKKMVSHWCASSCVCVGLSCSWRQSCSLDTCEDAGRSAVPCGSNTKQNVNHNSKEQKLEGDVFQMSLKWLRV